MTNEQLAIASAKLESAVWAQTAAASFMLTRLAVKSGIRVSLSPSLPMSQAG